MSKRLKNYPELSEVLDNYGADALRFYLLSSQAVRAEDLAFSEKGLDEVVKKILNRLDNVVTFYELYSKPDIHPTDNQNVLDLWIEARLNDLIESVTSSLNNYELDKATKPIVEFIDDLSTWYLRRSRNRPEALPKLRESILILTRVMAPLTPFIAEDIYQKLRTTSDPESVHLESWPTLRQGSAWQAMQNLFAGKTESSHILENMAETRRLVSLALELRSKANIKVRQPLRMIKVKGLKLEAPYLELIKDEVNVKEVVEDTNIESELELDTDITPELKEEGEVRELIRSIQDLRKEKNLSPKDKMKYQVSEEHKNLFTKYGEEIRKVTNIDTN